MTQEKEALPCVAKDRGAEAPSHPKPENREITACGECLEERQAALHTPACWGKG